MHRVNLSSKHYNCTACNTHNGQIKVNDDVWCCGLNKPGKVWKKCLSLLKKDSLCDLNYRMTHKTSVQKYQKATYWRLKAVTSVWSTKEQSQIKCSDFREHKNWNFHWEVKAAPGSKWRQIEVSMATNYVEWGKIYAQAFAKQQFPVPNCEPNIPLYVSIMTTLTLNL